MDILEFAINMELEGNKYYKKQADKNKHNSLAIVFDLLAEDELKHAELIRAKKRGEGFSSGSVKNSEAEGIFSDKDQKISEITATPEQIDAYRFALDKESESIDLYKELREKNEKDKEFYDFLIAEEQKHFKLVGDMVEALSRPKEWVESAEFGVREDY